ncbi:MAG: hypothetical protein ACLPKW_35675 [Acetobacteraceae bacterium]
MSDTSPAEGSVSADPQAQIQQLTTTARFHEQHVTLRHSSCRGRR